MTRLTKEIADSVRKTNSVSRFFFLGNIKEVSFFKALFINGGKIGFPCVFGIDSKGNVSWFFDHETLSLIYKNSTLLEEVFV